MEIVTECLPVTQGKHNIAVTLAIGKGDNNRIGQIHMKNLLLSADAENTEDQVM